MGFDKELKGLLTLDINGWSQGIDQASNKTTTLDSKMKSLSSGFSSSTNQMTSNANSLSQSMNSVSSSGNTLNSVIMRYSTTANQASASIGALSASLGTSSSNMQSASTTATNLSTNMTNLSSSSMNTTTNFQTLTNVASQTSQSTQQLGESLNNTNQSFNSTNQTLMQTDSSMQRTTMSFQQFASSAVSGVNSGLDKLKSSVSGLNSQLGTVGQVASMAFGSLGLGSVYQATIGLALSREQMTALMHATMGSKDAAQQMVGSLDELTNKSLVSLDQIGSAISVTKMVTGMTNDQLKMVVPTLNEIGQRAILMGYDYNRAQLLMEGAFRGLNGNFQLLRMNFGVTKDALQDLGWSGAASDVEGYNSALLKYLERGGKVEDMMNTTTGLIELSKKAFRIAGREIGMIFIPAIRGVLEWFIKLRDTNPRVLQGIILLVGAFSSISLILPILVPIISAFQKLGSLVSTVASTVQVGFSSMSAMSAMFGNALATATGGLMTFSAAEAQVMLSSTGVTTNLAAATPVLGGYTGANLAAAGATVTFGSAIRALGASLWALAINPITIALVALAAAVYLVYKQMENATAGMAKYNDIMENGEEKIKDLRSASESYIKKANDLEKTRSRLIAQGEDVTKVDEQIADAHKKAAEYAKMADDAEKALEKGRERRSIIQAESMGASKDYRQYANDIRFGAGLISEAEYESNNEIIKTIEYGTKTQQDALDRKRRLLGIGRQQVTDIVKGDTSYADAWKRDEEGLDGYVGAWEELGAASENLTNAKDVGEQFTAWSQVAWLQGSIAIGEFNKAMESLLGFDLEDLGNALYRLITPAGWIQTWTELPTILENAKKGISDWFAGLPAWLDEQFKNVLNWFGSLPGLIGGEIAKLWDSIVPPEIKDAFAPAFDSIKQAFGELGGAFDEVKGAFSEVVGALQEVWNALFPPETKGKGVEETVKKSSDAVKDAKPAFDIFKDVLKGVVWVVKNLVVPAIQGFAWFITDIVVPVIKKVSDGFNALAGFIRGVGEWIDWLKAQWTFLTSGEFDIGQMFTDMLNELPYTIGYVLGTIISTITEWGTQLWDSAVLAGQNFIDGVVTFFSELPTRILEWLVATIADIATWGDESIAEAERVGREFVDGVVTFFSELPERVGAWLVQTKNRIITIGREWVANAKTQAISTVNAVINRIKELPRQFMAELKSIANNIISAGKTWVANAKTAAANTVKGFIDGLQRKSPGKMAKEMLQEVRDIETNLIEGQEPLYNAAMDLGSQVVAGFGTPSVEVVVGATAGEEGGLELINDKANALNQDMLSQVTSSAAQVDSLNNQTVNNTTGAFGEMSETVSSSFIDLADTTDSTMADIRDTTGMTMDDIETSTTDNISNIESSWNQMEVALINSAQNIRVKTGNHIDKLESNMASFWRKIKNPGSLLGGAGYGGYGGYAGGNYSGGNSRGFLGSRYQPYIGKMQAPRMDISRLMPKRSSPINTQPPAAGHTSKVRSPEEVTGRKGLWLLDNLPPIDCGNPDGCYAAGAWDLGDWYNPIKTDMHKWNTNFGAVFDPYLNVGKFENDNFPVKGNAAAYEKFMMQEIGKTNYQFYFNSKGGSLASIFNSGSFNCWDGAHILMGFANAFGLGSSLRRGKWGGINHVWANVQGVGDIDATAIQKGYGKMARGKVSAGSPPSDFFGGTNDNNSEPTTQEVKIQMGDIHIHGDIYDENALVQLRQDIMKDNQRMINEKLSPNSITGGRD